MSANTPTTCLDIECVVLSSLDAITSEKRARDTKNGSYNSVERPDKVSCKCKAACK